MTEMDDDNDSQYLFASCEITWKIENFCFAYPLNKCSILSPEFMLQGLKSVKWRMSLELQDEMSPEKPNMEMPPVKTKIEKSPENGQVSIYLEMLPSSLAKNIFVNWEMTLTAGRKVFGPSERKDEFVEHSKHGHIGIATTNEILEHLLNSKDGTISICFYLIAFDKDKFFIPQDEKPPSIILLYQDLKHFKDMKENYSDIKLKVKDGYIKAHKIVLSCNEIFFNYFEQVEDDVLEISDFDVKTLDAFVNFLYTLDVSYCLEDLSIWIIRCLKYFNSDALKPYYIPEELPLNSKIQIKQHEFKWYVPDILHKNDFTITSPSIKFLDSSTTWLLKISMTGDDDRSKFISIFAEITAGERPLYFSLEFALINESQREFFSRRLVRNNESYENLGFDEFVNKKDICKNRSLSNHSVNFLFRIKTSNGIQECSIGCHEMHFTLPTKSKPYKQISAKMGDFYENEMYTDITVECRGQMYWANKFILAAHSPIFRQKIENIENNEDSIDITHISPFLLGIILKYMYTGVLEDDLLDVAGVIDLFQISARENFNIPSLHKECSVLFALKERVQGKVKVQKK